jgi:septum formation protein
VSPPVPRLILASASPRRQELLGLLGLPFEVIPSEVDEAALVGELGEQPLPAEMARRLAEVKAADVAARHPDALVLGADTIVVLGDAILGKPVSPDDARRMLALLSGRTHQVITGVALRGPGVGATDAVSTDVTFRELTPREIDAYVATGEPMDKAGAYALQGRAAVLIEGIRGDYTNVVGLPIPRLAILLRRHGIPILGESS